MLKTLFQRKVPEAPIERASIPSGRRVYAIGDVHGCYDLLEQLLHQIVEDDQRRSAATSVQTNTELIFLGDLVDRGPDSRQVIELTLRLKREVGGVRFLMGNHEEMMLKAAAGDVDVTRMFIRNGGRETILSYGLPHSRFIAMDSEELAGELPSLFPADHIDFIAAFEDQIIIGDYVFVHAGIKPGIPLEEQEPRHLRWIRKEFFDHTDPFEKIVVYGHTISEEIVEAGNRIGIDTGAYESGRLTALGLEGSERWYIDTAES